MEAIKTSVTNSPVESEVKGKVVKKSGKRIGYNYIILRSLKESQKNDVVTCLYIKSLINFGICVIKEGTYGDSKDKQGRDIKDRLMWQKELHEKLQGRVRLPRLLGSFEENGNYYLVLERIKGKSLYKVCREASKDLREGLITGNKLGMKFLGYMIQMIELLETLHQHGVVHRDVTATNFMITPAGRVAVIDMELSYSLDRSFPSPPFQLGTYGYMSPEQEVTAMPAFDQDVYSVGVILLQMWTGIWPLKFSHSSFDQLSEEIKFFIPDRAFADIVIQCFHYEPKLRPRLEELRTVLTTYRNNLKNKISQLVSQPKKFHKNEILDNITNAIGSLSSSLLADEEKGWFSENTLAPPGPDKKKINKGWYASFHKGAAGVIYFVSKANSLGFDTEATRPFLQKGIELIRTRYINRQSRISPSLYFGGSGIAAVLAIAMQERLLEPQTDFFEWINKLLDIDNQGYGFQDGISGQGMANWHSAPFLHQKNMQKRLQGYVYRLLDVQEKDGSWLRNKNEKRKRVTRGFAHGMAGIIYFLMEYARAYNDKAAMESAKRGLQWLMKKSIRTGDMIEWRSYNNKEIPRGWSEGTAGIALTFIKAFSVFGDNEYRKYAVDALNSQNKNTIQNNLSQYNGLTGLGEIYLEAFRVLQDENWLKQANHIAQVLMHLTKHSASKPYWLVQNERQPIADFMGGNSGVLHFLLRNCYPDSLGHPLLL